MCSCFPLGLQGLQCIACLLLQSSLFLNGIELRCKSKSQQSTVYLKQYINPGLALFVDSLNVQSRLKKTAHACLTMYECYSPEVTLQNTCSKVQVSSLSGTGHEDVLKAVDLPIVSRDRCREMHRGNIHITNTKICAGGRRNEGVCEVNNTLFYYFSMRSNDRFSDQNKNSTLEFVHCAKSLLVNKNRL